jgi:WD40 repeat protein
MTISEDGTTLAVVDAAHGLVHFYHMSTGTLLGRIAVDGQFGSPLFFPDRESLGMVEEREGRLCILNIQARKLKTWAVKQDGPVKHLLIAPQGKTLLIWLDPERDSPSRPVTIRLFDVATEREIGSFAGQRDRVTSIRFSEDGRQVASASADGTVVIWDTSTRREFWRREAATSRKVSTATEWEKARIDLAPAFSEDLSVIATYSDLPNGERDVLLWKLTGSSAPRRLGSCDRDFNALFFTPKGKWLAGIDSKRQRVIFWDLTSGRACQPLRCYHGLLGFVCLAPDRSCLVYLDRQGRIASCQAGRGLAAPSEDVAEAFGIAYAPDGKALGVMDEHGTLRVWDCQSGRERFSLQSPRWSFAFLRARGAILMQRPYDSKGPATEAVSFYDPITGNELQSLRSRQHLFQFATSHDGAIAVLRGAEVSDGKTSWVMSVFKTRTGEHIGDIPDHIELPENDPVAYLSSWLVLSPNGTQVAIAPLNGSLEVWDLVQRRPRAVLRELGASIEAAAYSPDGKWIGTIAHSAMSGKWLRLWDATTHKQLPRLAVIEGDRSLLAFSWDGRLIAHTGKLGEIVVRETLTGQILLSFREEHNYPVCVCFSPDGRNLASGMTDGTALVWSLEPLPRRKGESLRPSHLTSSEWWNELAIGNGPRGYAGVYSLSCLPEQAVGFLGERLHPLSNDRILRIHQLIAELDDRKFSIREKATKALQELGWEAEKALKKAVRSDVGLECRSRAERLLNEIRTQMSSTKLQAFRAIWILERVATAPAQAILRRLSAGDPDDPLKAEADLALQRLAEQKNAWQR